MTMQKNISFFVVLTMKVAIGITNYKIKATSVLDVPSGVFFLDFTDNNVQLRLVSYD